MSEPIEELRPRPGADSAASEERVQRILRRAQVETASGDALTFLGLRMWKALVIVGALIGAVLGRRRAEPPHRDG